MAKKKVVRVESTAKSASPKRSPKTSASSSSSSEGGLLGGGLFGGESEDPPAGWKPTAEAKSKAGRKRLLAAASWAVAIGLELFSIFWLLKRDPFETAHLVALIGLIVVIGALTIVGSTLWKGANRLDPARRSDTIRFFIQNQLGVLVALIAFVPLIILVFTNKNMSGKQKTIAGVAGIIVAGIAAVAGVTTNSPSVEQYTAESNVIAQLTGEDLVYWTASGSVFHVCSEVPDVNKESADNQIYSGTVADAHEAGKDRLTKRWESEATKYCGYAQEEVDAVKADLPDDVSEIGGDSETEDPDTTPTSTTNP